MSTSLPEPDTQLFRDAMASFASGVNVISVWDVEGRPYGMTVSAFASVSIAPQLVLVCLNRECRTYLQIRQARAFGVNILGLQGQEIADYCSQPGVDKTLPGDWLCRPAAADHSGHQSAPELCEALAFVGCAVHSEVPAGATPSSSARSSPSGSAKAARRRWCTTAADTAGSASTRTAGPAP